MGTEKRERQKQQRQARLEAAREEQRKKQQRRRWITIAIAVVVVFGGMFIYSTFLADGGDDETAADTTTTTGVDADADAPFAFGSGECAPDTPPAEPVIDYDDSFQDCLDPGAAYTAVFDTTEGEIRVDLDTTATPGTSNNFVNLARNGYYDGTEIFRTDTSIGILQGGSPHTNDASDPGPGFNIPDEGDGYTYEAGQLVMARSAGPDSGSAQFFLVANDAASSLNAQGTYVVFGNTDEAGIDVITGILDLNEDDPESGLGGAPSRAVTINSVTIEERPAEGNDDSTPATAPAGDATTTTAG